MDANHNRFQERLRRIEGGAVQSRTVRPDGLIVPRRRRSLVVRVPWRSVMLALVCCFLLKGGLIWHQGAVEYADRLAELEGQGGGHAVAAWILSIDPLSAAIANGMTGMIGPPPR